ncbi:ABC-F family ATP-binding cassette domain-containing protein [Acetobacterium woodii]|uniref:Putative ABC transport system containing duplicated ATPase domain n=1 Tax=Acetobacterium woodii (strain ATCC 29683 / DSM 1030 / JCM 2381 / KCTC 1655 / WB1) TaxID=931626 RepID=H6LI15_ACEWD|nr:ABC-F family ATP-binding cassette domain-containing protein [Acetobacterium woodii]AFA48545.1 putative ABC transport system containing duplicated ATPase domain [Acetobacterium woodii DSM 1030]
MGLLDVINITHSFGDKTLYQEASFELFKGEHMGIVGRNGTGKTTLLNSLIGEVIPDGGEIRWQKGIKVGYLDQHAKIDREVTVFDYLKTAFLELYKTEAQLTKIYENMGTDSSEKTMNRASDLQTLLENSGFYELESRILKIADGLGITALGMDSILEKLSGGQRAKVILAKLLLEEPNVLLLDEPTNFLDKEHVEWLTDYLKSYEGAFMVISHDFDFLDRITTCICDIEFCTIKKYNGNISKFIQLKGLRRESYIREFEAQKKEIKKFEDYISKNKARASTAAMAKSRQKQLDKIDRIAPPELVPKPNFRFTATHISNQRSLTVKDLVIGYDYALLAKMNFKVESAQKIVITGFNGIGKSTLLKTLVKQISPLSGKFKFADNIKLAYFEQDLNWESPLQTPIQVVSDVYPKLSQSQLRRYLAQCGLKAKSMAQGVSTLSGGEQAKVKICILMLTQANFLILDEPTNHLDSDAKEVLKKELIKWEGSLILVSHEASFYEDWADEIINIES